MWASLRRQAAGARAPAYRRPGVARSLQISADRALSSVLLAHFLPNLGAVGRGPAETQTKSVDDHRTREDNAGRYLRSIDRGDRDEIGPSMQGSACNRFGCAARYGGAEQERRIGKLAKIGDGDARDRFTMNRPSYAQMLAQGAIAFSNHDEDALDCAYTD